MKSLIEYRVERDDRIRRETEDRVEGHMKEDVLFAGPCDSQPNHEDPAPVTQTVETGKVAENQDALGLQSSPRNLPRNEEKQATATTEAQPTSTPDHTVADTAAAEQLMTTPVQLITPSIAIRSTPEITPTPGPTPMPTGAEETPKPEVTEEDHQLMKTASEAMGKSVLDAMAAKTDKPAEEQTPG